MRRAPNWNCKLLCIDYVSMYYTAIKKDKFLVGIAISSVTEASVEIYCTLSVASLKDSFELTFY